MPPIAGACEALLARARGENPVRDTLWCGAPWRSAFTVTVSVSKLRNLVPPLWRWFLQRA